ncbi:MAG: glucose-6-phosphate isomerase family protein [Acidobacteriaceae bacterium]
MASHVSMNWQSGLLSGTAVQSTFKTLGAIRDLFYDQEAAAKMPADLVVYTVQAFTPVPDGTEGGLFWGSTTLQPGKVGEEYFMTKGHFHQIRNRAEYYAAFHGEGALLLMGEDGMTRWETMRPGSVHYIPGNTAHRVCNTGSNPLVFAACWPSDAGHDYETIEREGFSGRLVERGGRPVLLSRDGLETGDRD